jgi:hypothetical protein
VYVDGQREKRYVQYPPRTPEAAEFIVDCGSSSLTTQTVLQPGSRFELRAVDLAGNESSPTTPFEVPDVCTAPSPDDLFFEMLPPEDGTPAPAGVANPRASGCALVPDANGTAATGAAGLALFCVWLARRLQRGIRRT